MTAHALGARGGVIGRRVALGWMGGLAATALGARASSAEQRVPAFSLEDQWERRHDQRVVFSGGTVVLVGGDQRATGDRVAEWARAFSDGFAFWGVVDLDAVPFFVPHGSIRSNLRQVCPKTVVLLDWSGKVYSPLFGFPTKREIVVQVHGPSAELLARVEGGPTAERIAAIRKAAGR